MHFEERYTAAAAAGDRAVQVALEADVVPHAQDEDGEEQNPKQEADGEEQYVSPLLAEEEEAEHWAQDTGSSWDSIVERASSPVDSSPRSTDSEGGFHYDTVSGDSDALSDEESREVFGAAQQASLALNPPDQIGKVSKAAFVHVAAEAGLTARGGGADLTSRSMRRGA